jgi:hypothetical protein
VDLTPRRTTISGADRRWIADRHGLDTARSVVLDADAFTGDTILSGTVIGIVTATRLGVPYDDAFDADPATAGQQVDGREVARGLLINDEVRKAGGRIAAAIYEHGVVDVDFLPIASGPGALDAAARADLTHIRFRG